ncbi:hypothetical protein QQF64_029427 [Cirrhinus molitorella]|uniref:Uncharacterized protein n=1 Tax=Cirrhinus molitorella TaxID=172907 RepID=A0ABR3N0Q4_9TELE
MEGLLPGDGLQGSFCESVEWVLSSSPFTVGEEKDQTPPIPTMNLKAEPTLKTEPELAMLSVPELKPASSHVEWIINLDATEPIPTLVPVVKPFPSLLVRSGCLAVPIPSRVFPFLVPGPIQPILSLLVLSNFHSWLYPLPTLPHLDLRRHPDPVVLLLPHWLC